MFNKLAIFSILYFGVTPVQAQGRVTHVFTLKDKANYSEQNIFLPGLSPSIIHKMFYDEPGTIDEEFSIILDIKVIDTSRITPFKVLNIARDTSAVKLSWAFGSIWNWEPGQSDIRGSMKFLSIANHAAEVELNIRIHDRGTHRTYVYKGTRAFRETDNVKKAE